MLWDLSPRHASLEAFEITKYVCLLKFGLPSYSFVWLLFHLKCPNMPFHTGGWPLHPADFFEAAYGFHVYLYAVSCRSAFLLVEIIPHRPCSSTQLNQETLAFAAFVRSDWGATSAAKKSTNTSSSPSGHLRLDLKSSHFLSVGLGIVTDF